ncbi:hypothetical protein HQQ82_02165 [Rathayibacter sp. VKM Ac-2856]|uniref:SGNH/GDSL hydrolase family protein n=1 Tax=unclassified Rathayibacter TaxID=2609250 RepID=UPI001564E332|nr:MULTISPECIES: SGNH/GDSL hydrolase family protein [unclassified Rathayibacter]NQX03599.1 hypothetical protein [Rathayibacter sp. VKM Ac-2858]NQX18767.1 hypothetical protein [Rathayibacter sp. VKM Ac-2856]
MSVLRPRRLRASLLGSALALVAALSAGGAVAPVAAAADSAPTPVLSYAAFGDSLTRAAATCGHSEADCPENSWATGTSPQVHSIAARLQQANPGRIVQADNFAKSGSRIADVAEAVDLARASGASPELVTVLVGGNDLCSPDVPAGPDGYAMTPAADFSASATRLLEQITVTWPRAKVLVASVPDIASEWQAVKGGSGELIWRLFSVCRTTRGADAANHAQTGAAYTAAVGAAAERTTQYNEALADACSAAGPRCVWDGGALARTAISSDLLSTVDWFHPNVRGQALIAEVVWGARAVRDWAVPPSSSAPAAIRGAAPATDPDVDASPEKRREIGMPENVTERVRLGRPSVPAVDAG